MSPAARNISVIVPFKNSERTLRETIDSLLIQKHVAEIVFVNDHSEDRSVAEIRKFHDPRIRILDSHRPGISAAVNVGLQNASCDFIARCDADDMFLPESFSRHLELMSAHPDYAAVCGRFRVIMETGFYAATIPYGSGVRDITESLKNGVYSTHLNTFLMRRSSLLEIGGAREWFISSEDLDLQSRLAFSGKVMMIDDVTYVYRLMNTSISHSAPNRQRVFFRSHAAKFARQRLEHGHDELDLDPDLPVDSSTVSGSAPMNARKRAASYALGEAWWLFDSGKFGPALKQAVRPILLHPLAVAHWKTIPAMGVKWLLR